MTEIPRLDTGKAAEWTRDRRPLLLEGFAVEEVTELCMSHGYRWRCVASHAAAPTFLINPVKMTTGAETK